MPYKLIEELFELNNAQSRVFIAAHDDRVRYRTEHPTEIAAFKCMDGRLHLPVMTGTPFGIIQPWRNIGGMFDLGWPFLGEKLQGWVRYAESRERQRLALLTYHFSKGNTHRGCAGFKYDTVAARASTEELKAQFQRLFSGDHNKVYPISLGIETDLDGLVFHGSLGATLNLEEVKATTSEADVRARLRKLYPDMHAVMLNDLLPLVMGNIRHIDDIRRQRRPVVEVEHRERVLAVGQGFDWLHRPNLALIVGPFSYDVANAIAVAAGIIKTNMEAKRIPSSGFVLLTSCPYRDSGDERLMAIERTRSYIRLALRVLEEKMPEMKKLVHPLTTIVALNTRKFEVIE